MPNTSKDTTSKADQELAARNKDISDLKGEVGVLKKYIGTQVVKEKKATDAAAESRRLSKNIKGLGRLGGLNSGLGNQSVKK